MMHRSLLRLASLVVLFVALPAWACSPPPLTGNKETTPTVRPTGEVRLKGELRFYRCIDPVTGQARVTLFTEGKELALDLRQFKLDILLSPGLYAIKGHWSKEDRLVVTAASPTTVREAVQC